MGLERFAALMQGTHDNYETDMFKKLIGDIANVTNTDIGDTGDQSRRVIADHLRSMSFLIAEGVLPSNEGRGYVLRRIMRRAMRHATLLGTDKPVIHSVVPTLVQEMGQAYPELVQGEQMISETVRLEEERFLKTLSRGLSILEEESAELGEGDVLDGGTAFKLYDTYGFPLDLTKMPCANVAWRWTKRVLTLQWKHKKLKRVLTGVVLAMQQMKRFGFRLRTMRV